jgi:hypothetical protein
MIIKILRNSFALLFLNLLFLPQVFANQTSGENGGGYLKLFDQEGADTFFLCRKRLLFMQ